MQNLREKSDKLLTQSNWNSKDDMWNLYDANFDAEKKIEDADWYLLEKLTA